MLSSVLPRAARVLDQSGKALAAGQRRRHGAPFVGPHGRGGVVVAREMSSAVPALPPSRDGGGRRRVLPGLSSPVDVDGGGDFVSVVVMLEAQTAPRSSYVVSSMLARLPCGGMGSLCVVPVLPDL